MHGSDLLIGALAIGTAGAGFLFLVLGPVIAGRVAKSKSQRRSDDPGGSVLLLIVWTGLGLLIPVCVGGVVLGVQLRSPQQRSLPGPSLWWGGVWATRIPSPGGGTQATVPGSTPPGVEVLSPIASPSRPPDLAPVPSPAPVLSPASPTRATPTPTSIPTTAPRVSPSPGQSAAAGTRTPPATATPTPRSTGTPSPTGTADSPSAGSPTPSTPTPSPTRSAPGPAPPPPNATYTPTSTSNPTPTASPTPSPGPTPTTDPENEEIVAYLESFASIVNQVWAMFFVDYETYGPRYYIDAVDGYIVQLEAMTVPERAEDTHSSFSLAAGDVREYHFYHEMAELEPEAYDEHMTTADMFAEDALDGYYWEYMPARDDLLAELDLSPQDVGFVE